LHTFRTAARPLGLIYGVRMVGRVVEWSC